MDSYALKALSGRDFVDLNDLSPAELNALLALAVDMKREQRAFTVPGGRTLITLYFNPSLRTRVSIDVAATALGINVVDINPRAESWDFEWRDGAVMDGAGMEHVKDAARVLSRYGHLIGVRSHPAMRNLAEDRTDPMLSAFRRHATIPVINLESATAHPCQGLADVMTLREAFPNGLKKRRVVLSWAPHLKALSHGVPNTFVQAACREGAEVVVAHPPGFELDADVMARATASATAAGGSLRVCTNRDEAFSGASVVYGKSWAATSCYGDETAQLALMREHAEGWRITAEAMKRTHRAKFMHPLPVRRNLVVDDAILDGPDCVVYQQAENRLHAQKALLMALMGGAA